MKGEALPPPNEGLECRDFRVVILCRAHSIDGTIPLWAPSAKDGAKDE